MRQTIAVIVGSIALALVVNLRAAATAYPISPAPQAAPTGGASVAPAAAPTQAPSSGTTDSMSGAKSSSSAGTQAGNNAAVAEGGTGAGTGIGANPTGTAASNTSAPGGFGYDAFLSWTGNISDGPIDDQYLMAPGDEIILTIWGAMTEKYNLVVSDQGFIDLPDEGGRISTNGVTLRELGPLITQALSQIFASYIDSTNPSKSTAFIDIRLGKIRTMLVYIVGEVNKPGAFGMSASVANLINALHNAGGVKPTGSLREIRIRRSDGRVDTVDLYDFVLTGEIDYKKIRLQPGDYVIVPLKRKSVSITGEVRRPTNYELVGDEGVKELVKFAGGFTSEAYLKQAPLQRFEVDRGEVFVDLNLSALYKDPKADFAMVDGDTLSISKNIQIRKNTVKISGDGITRPGTYEFMQGMTLTDLIVKAEGLREYAWLDRADIIRTDDDFTKRLITFGLNTLYVKDAATGKFVVAPVGDTPAADTPNIALREMDEVLIQSAWGLSGKDKIVTLKGHVKEGGPTILAQNMKLYDLIFMRGGFQDAAFLKGTFLDTAHILRKVPGAVGQKIISFNLGDLLNRVPAANLALEENDVITIYTPEDVTTRSSVTLSGLVKNPGAYPMIEGLTLEDLIVLAGGLLPEATKVEAVIARTATDGDHRDIAGQKTAESFIVPVPESYITLATDKRTALRRDDQVAVRSVSGWEARDVIFVEGQVALPGYYLLSEKGETLSAMIARAGGLRREALPAGAVLRRRATVVRLDGDGNSGSPSAITTSPTIEVAIDLVAALAKPGSSSDIVLLNGDRVVVPTNPGTIQISGAVTRPLTLQHKAGLTVSDYVNMCGGFLEKADINRIVVVAPNNVASMIVATDKGLLSPGSVVTVPLQRDTERMRTVEIKGAVQKPAMVQYIEGASLGYYLNLCGGLTQNGDVDRILVQLPDGGLLMKQGSSPFNPLVPAGSMVVVANRPNIETK